MTASQILQSVTRGLQDRPQKVVVYGPEGVGKTTWASHCPNPLYIDTEDGTGHLDVPRLKPASIADVDAIIDALASDPSHGYKTLIIDTIDWLESLMVADLLASASKPGTTLRSLEDFGYGKGYTLLADRMRKFLDHCAKLLRAGINIVMLAHSRRVKFEAPESASAYDKYELKLTKTVAPLIKEWSDALLFVNYVTVVKDHKGYGGSERVIYTSPQAPWEAKNRQGLPDMMRADDVETIMPKLFAHTLRSSAPSGAPAEHCAELQACIRKGLPVTRYLQSLGWLTDTQTTLDLTQVHCDRITRSQGKFTILLTTWAESHD